MHALLNGHDGPALVVAAIALAGAVLAGIVFLAVRLNGVEEVLAEAQARAADAGAELDQTRAELALVRERLVQTRRAAGRAQAEAAERDVRVKPMHADDHRSWESRLEVAQRVIADALRDQRQ